MKERVVAAAILAVLAPGVSDAQGFGKSKRKIVLHRKLPATAPLTGKTFTVRVTARESKYSNLSAKLADMVEAEIVRNDHRFTPQKTGSDNLVTCVINNVSTPPPAPVSRNVINEQKVGKDIRKASEQHTFMKVSGMMSLTYQSRNPAGALDSDNTVVKFSEEYDDETGQSAAKGWFDTVKRPIKKIVPGRSEEEAPQTSQELEQVLLNRAAAWVAQHVVNTQATATIYLAHGKGLDNACKAAEAGLYSRMLEDLETMEPFPRGEDDAYRLYDVGVAYEALSYQAEDPKAASKFLEEASINYGKALDAHPSEQYFADAQQRIETSLAYFRKIQGQGTVAASAPAAPPPAAPIPAAAPAGARAAGPPGAMTNAQVVQLVRAGLSEDNVVAAIKAAAKVQFDVSANGQLQLAQNGVSNRVIAAMREKAAAPTAHRAPPAAATQPKQKSLSDILDGKQ